MRQTFFLMAMTLLTVACSNTKKQTMDNEVPVAIQFSADSAYAFCQHQCDFGPRTMNSEAHEQCGQWIVEKFQSFGMQVTEQRATLTGFDGTPLLGNNIIARYQPALSERVMLCAHWDSRPWADNDPDEANHTKPVLAANDGASGVAVMLELARLLQADTCLLPVGVDFVCFDAEDWGSDNVPESWALGAQHWAREYSLSTKVSQLSTLNSQPSTLNSQPSTLNPRYGILLDMVGGQGARFYQEGYSLYYAPTVVKRVWKAAAIAGFSSYFPMDEGGTITDDHGPVNEIAEIPCIDIIPYYPACRESSFGPTWHTVNDDMDHIDRGTLKAVGQTLVQVLWTEK
jgi:hypothetical protein